MKKKNIGKLQQMFLQYKAHAFTPGPKLLRDRTLTMDVAEAFLSIQVDGLRALRSLATEKALHTFEVRDSHGYNEAEFGHVLGPGKEYIRRLLGPCGIDSRIALELLYRANLSCDLWEQRIIADCSPAFSVLTDTRMRWKATNSKHAPLVTEDDELQLIAHVGCFPDEYLYHILQGHEELGQLNDWPSVWSRTTDNEIQTDVHKPNVFERLAADQRQGLWANEDPRLARKYLFSDSEKGAQR